MKTVGIIGYGEIGQALDDIYLSEGYFPLIKDIDRDDGLAKADIVHICIPWNENFIAIARQYLEDIQPKMAIIHSTVAPGTTRELSKVCPNICHSPIRGIHPHLTEGIKTFVKVFGGPASEEASDHFQDLGIETEVYEDSQSTEIAKLLDTSYYGVCIAWHDYAKKLCDLWGVDFDEVQTDYNESYNAGYKTLDMEEVVRPTLIPPDGSIGGHCVVPNAELLREILDSPLLQGVTNLK